MASLSFVCLICLTVILALSFPFVQGQKMLLEIINRGNVSDYPPITASKTYTCKVRWHAKALPNADLRFMVSLLNADTKTLLREPYQYVIQAGREQYGETIFQINVPIESQGIVSWRLEVTLTPVLFALGPSGQAPADSYAWSVNTTPIPEFSTTAIGLVMFLSLLICSMFGKALGNTHLNRRVTE